MGKLLIKNYACTGHTFSEQFFHWKMTLQIAVKSDAWDDRIKIVFTAKWISF